MMIICSITVVMTSLLWSLGKSGAVVAKTDKLSTAKRSKGPVRSETSLPKTGSVRVPIPGKKTVKGGGVHITHIHVQLF